MATPQVAPSVLPGSATYQAIVKDASKKFNVELNYGNIAVVFILSIAYMILASIGIDLYSKCAALEDSELQQGLNKWLVATLAISLTIPFTLFITKTAGKNLNAVMMMIFAILGIIGSSTILNWTTKCESKNTESAQIYSGINLAVSVLMCLLAMFLMRSKVKVP